MSVESELQELQGGVKAAAEALAAEAARLNADGYTPTAADEGAFAALKDTFDANKKLADDLKAKAEMASARTQRDNAASEAAEFSTKFRREFLRNPNYTPDRDTVTGKLAARRSMTEDTEAAICAWTKAAFKASQITEAEASACRRIGQDPAQAEFAPALSAQGWEGYRRWLVAMIGKQGNTNAANLESVGYLAGSTDPLDSRDPQYAGYLNRPSAFMQTLEFNIVSYGGILTAPITIDTTGHYDDVVETFGDDTSNEGRQIGEGQTIGTTKQPKFGKITWTVFDYTSDDVVVSERQLERSNWSIPGFVPRIQGERLGRILARKLTTGTGTGEPEGVVTASTRGGKSLTTAASLAIGYDDLVKLEATLDEAYANSPNAGYMMHRNTAINHLRLIKDGEGKPILNMGMEGTGTKWTLFGRPIFTNYSVAEVAASAKAIIYGDWSAVVHRRVGAPRLIRDETTLRRSLQVIFTTIVSCDSRVRNYGTAPLTELRIKA